MSVTYLLFFVCIYFHVYCSALSLSTLDNKKLKKESHFSSKTDKIYDLESLPRNFQVKNKDNKLKTWLVNEKTKKERVSNKKVLKGMRKDSCGSETNSDHVSVSWRVPHHKKPNQKNPGFNIDYSPPKTHPPSHN